MRCILKLTTYKHEASRGLSATAELLVPQPSQIPGLRTIPKRRLRMTDRNAISITQRFVTFANKQHCRSTHLSEQSIELTEEIVHATTQQAHCRK